MSVSCSQIATVRVNDYVKPQIVRLIDTVVDEKGVSKFSFEASEGDWSLKFDLSELFIDKSLVDKSTTHGKEDYLGGHFAVIHDYEGANPLNPPVRGFLDIKYDPKNNVFVADPLEVLIGTVPNPSCLPPWTFTLKVPETEEA